MNTRRLSAAALTLAAVLAISAPLALRATAQQNTEPSDQGPPAGPRQGGGFAQPGQGGFAPQPGQPGQAGGRPGQGGMMGGGFGGGGGSAAIALDQTHVYIVQGGTLYKVNKGDLKVAGQTRLQGDMPPMGGGQGFDRNPGGGQRGGGGGTPPPPPTEAK